jgi:hypothetical protein
VRRPAILACSVLGAVFLILPEAGPTAAQPVTEKGKCGAFFDKWNAPGVPPHFTLMAGMGLELFAANDSVNQKKMAMACDHYRRALGAVDKMESALADERRPKVKALMAGINCR